MKNKKTIIKQIKQGLKVAVATGIILLSCSSCALSSDDYSSQQQIEENAEFLDCDLNYFNKFNGNFVRMKHNDGEPIYICFDEDFTDELKTKTKESLDYIFGIVGKINSNYNYKIVDKKEFDLKTNKTKIYYTFGEYVSKHEAGNKASNGHIVSYPNLSMISDNPVIKYYEINLNKNQSLNDTKLNYVLNHELLHAFGFDDVYTVLINQSTTKYYGNTYMNNTLELNMITPNDLACLISLYADESCDMEKMAIELEKYETKFYKHYADLCKQKIQTDENFTEDNFNFITSFTIQEVDGSKHGYKYKIGVSEGDYTFEIYDYYSDELLDSCNGKTTTENGVLILKDINLKVGIRPNDPLESFSGGFVQDFTFLTKNGNSIFYDYANNKEHLGVIEVYEKSLVN